ncbi:putative adenine-specific methylase [Paenibacillus sp. J53TS2]|uniref:adenine-specific methyltransferase EcoRI family protein n=1 Tax=Paenibacillus sp. J53TS2 TaxID=2807197 RepID=UPI001AFD0AA1|nr:adenine-specific methyltransferase EcoRI family protein [Paenibacillus sp. J53TS2]GIP49001.1 putative adenine-specific methylase [Paenibacillus sp. J53TS2]
MANKNLTNAKRVKNDEFYTQYGDIQKEIEAYLEYNSEVFRGKVVYCNCDDPYESNFFRYFALNFNRIGLKQLITTSYKPSPIANMQIELFSDDSTLVLSKDLPKITANRFIINEVHDIDGDGEFNLKDVALQLKANKNNEWAPLEGDGDFRSDECVDLLKQSDIVITNPPFSLFREYVKQLFDYNKFFLIIGSMNAITYKEIFPLIRNNKMWLGNGFNAGNAYFYTPNTRNFASGVFDETTGLVKFRNVCWFTNLDHGRRHQPLPLMTMSDNLKYSKHKGIKGKEEYIKYDNYDAIEVPFTDAIPSDYDGVMGVPISFLDKYSPEQFEILGTSDNGLVDDELKKTPGLTKEFVEDYYKAGGTGAYKEGNPTAGYYEDGVAKMAYKRIFIKHKGS